MKHALSILAFLLPAALVLAGCCARSDNPLPENRPAERCPEACPCDCPAGPPAPGQVSTFCLAPEHDGAVCCLGPPQDGGPPPTGVCHNLECTP